MYRKDATKCERRRKEKEKRKEGEMRENARECEKWEGRGEDIFAYL